MKRYLLIMLVLAMVFGVVSCGNTDTDAISQDVAEVIPTPDNDDLLLNDAKEDLVPEIAVIPVGTQCVIDDLIGVTVYAYYAEKDAEMIDWASNTYVYNYIGIYLSVENLSDSPIDEVVFGARRPDTIESVMPDFYIQTASYRVALNGRFFGDGGTYDNYDESEVFLMPGTVADNCYVGAEVDSNVIDEFLSDVPEACLVMLYDGQEYLFAIEGAERLETEK